MLQHEHVIQCETTAHGRICPTATGRLCKNMSPAQCSVTRMIFTDGLLAAHGNKRQKENDANQFNIYQNNRAIILSSVMERVDKYEHRKQYKISMPDAQERPHFQKN